MLAHDGRAWKVDGTAQALVGPGLATPLLLITGYLFCYFVLQFLLPFLNSKYFVTSHIIHTGDTGLRGPNGEAGIPGAKGDKGDQG